MYMDWTSKRILLAFILRRKVVKISAIIMCLYKPSGSGGSVSK